MKYLVSICSLLFISGCAGLHVQWTGTASYNSDVTTTAVMEATNAMKDQPKP